mmetsp:Transcript_16815/g.35382  ORF Transcript_16815/g.35382 Transcript_16815/m.35382 type:complete len:390 (+) Transcript_16815:124-1293(+)
MLSAKNASLLAGIFQQTALVLIIRYSKTKTHTGSDGDDDNTPSYLNSVAVASAEVFKLCLAFVLEFITTRKSHQSENGASTRKGDGGGIVAHVQKTIKPMLICNDRESIKLIVPALLYLIQNNLLFVALANLSVGMYQVTNQGKLLTTALLSRIMLKKQLSGGQYVSIALLGFGVAFIHLSEHWSKAESTRPDVEEGQNQILGLIAVLICCVTSSFSGVYFEFVLKKSPTQLSVHCRNFHLASWSLILAIIHILSHDLEQVKQYGVFHGFDILVVLVVIMQGVTGFVVSMMIKYADNVLKGFAIAIAAVLATLVSVPLFGASISGSFVVGASIVACAVKMYSYYDGKKSNKSVEVVAKTAPTTVVEEKDEMLGLLEKGGVTSTPSKEVR